MADFSGKTKNSLDRGPGAEDGTVNTDVASFHNAEDVDLNEPDKLDRRQNADRPIPALAQGDRTIAEVSEDGVARELVRQYGMRLRFDNSRNAWFIWENDVWRKDETHRVRDRIRKIMRAATETLGEKEMSRFRRANFVSGSDRLAQSDPLVSVTNAYWDIDDMLLGCPGVVVDLRTGRKRAPDPQDGITKLCGIAPAEGDCPTWYQFLTEATGEDEDVMRFIQVWMGYLLTGRTDEQVLLFIHGPGGNGKSVFLNIASRLLGDYSTTAAMDTFTSSRGDRHPTDLAMLRGARSVSVSETENGRAWSETRIKQLTGGDDIAARFMRQDFFTFRPSFKLTIVGNHQPLLTNVDPAMARRFLVLPFEHQPKTVDPDLEGRLWKEAPQILAWAIRGCLEWQEQGLPRPAAIQAATQQYLEEQDTFTHWLEESCDLTVSHKETKAADLYASWKCFAESHGEDPGSSKSLGQKLRRKGLKSGQKRLSGSNCKVWQGIALR